MKRYEAEIAVIGAGFAGLSTAYHLAQRGHRVAVLERENETGRHASGKNAGMIRQAISDPLLARLAHEGCEKLESAAKNGFGRFQFKRNGSLLLASGSQVRELRSIERAIKKEKIPAIRLAPNEAVRRVPLLAGGRFDEALFCRTDAFVDIHALLEAFVRELQKIGARVYFGSPIKNIRRVPGGFVVGTSKGEFSVKKVVNAAGAWAGLIGQKAGAFPVPLVAYRRHLFWTGPRREAKKNWPFVWDLSHDFYFRPLGGGLLVSPCDKTPMRLGRQPGKAEKIEPGMQKILQLKLRAFSKRFPRLSFRESKAALRTMTPDGKFVIGEDPRVKGFFWVAGLGGHGVTTCFSVGRLAADCVEHKKTDKTLLNAFSPERFTRKKNAAA